MDQAKSLVEVIGSWRLVFKLQKDFHQAIKLLICFIEIKSEIVSHLVSWQVVRKGLIVHD